LLFLCFFFFPVVHFGFCVGGSCELKGYLLNVFEIRTCCSLKPKFKFMFIAHMLNFKICGRG
jgi:hypothetical protein